MGRARTNDPAEMVMTRSVILPPIPVNRTTPITTPAVAQAPTTMTQLYPVLARASNILDGIMRDSFLKKLMTTVASKE